MAVLSPATGNVVSPGNALRRRVGLGVAVAWILTYFWYASPLPFVFAKVLGSWIIINATQERGLMLGFALCLAFLLFEPRRLKLPPAADFALASVAAFTGSVVAWNYNRIAGNVLDPGGFSLIVALLGTALLLLACLRVFRWLGWVLLGLVAFVHLAPLALNEPIPHGLDDIDTLLSVHWFTSESIFGVFLSLATVVGFALVMLGVAYDVMGSGRRLAEVFLRFLPPGAPRAELVQRSRIAARLWALVALCFLFVPSVPSLNIEDAPTFRPLILVFAVYAVSCGVAWSSRLTASVAQRERLLKLGAGGLLLGGVLILAAVLGVANSLFASILGGLSVRLPGPAGSLVMPAFFLMASLLLTAAAVRWGPAGREKLLYGGLELLPLLLFLWMLSVDRVSPGLAGAYANILMLVVMAGVAAARRARAASTGAERPSFTASYFLPLCHGVARVMVRVVIFAALYGMLMPWAWFWAPLIFG